MKSRTCLPSYTPLLLSVIGLLSLAMATLAQPTLPNINTNNIITITNAPYNAVGDGVSTNTIAILMAITNAAAGGNTNGLFGGTVRIPMSGIGTYLCGPLTLKNNVNIQIDAGVTLQMLPVSVWTNLPAQNLTYGDLIYASGVTNLEISGSGTIDGNGAGWWNLSSSSPVYGNRPYMIFFNGKCNQVLVEGVTVQNPPMMHFVFKNSGNGNITFQNMTINTTAANAANTDGIDLVGTNCLIQNCTNNAGDDNIALGSSTSSAISKDVVVTNCTFGVGHGVSIGSNTAGAVSNLTVIHCFFNGTDYGIRMKSNDATSNGSGQGGIAQNLSYLNLVMTNIVDGAIVIYSYYSSTGGIYGTPTTVTPFIASTQAVDTTTVPVWRNITISNVTATVASGGVPGIIWARMEVPATNIFLSHVNITASKSFDLYNARGFQFADSTITVPAGTTSFLLYNAQLIITNSVFTTNLVTFDGLTTNGYGNSLAFYNAQTSLINTNVFDDSPLTIADSTLTISNNFTLFPSTILNYVLDSNTNQVAVVGNLTMGGTINVTTNTSGFGAGTNALLTDTGTLSGNLPMLGSTPGGAYTYTLVTNIVSKQLDLVVASTSTSTTTTTSVQSSANPSTYGNTVMVTATVSPAPTNGETVTFKDGSTTLGTGTLNGGQATFSTTATRLAAASHSITAVYAGDGAFGASSSSVLTQTVNPLGLTVSGLTISNKVYNKATAAMLNTNGYTLNTVISGDVVTLATNGYTANFASSNVANGITITVAGLSLGGAQAGNYTLTQPAGLTANITPLGLTVSGLTISNKVYNRATVATLNTNGYTLNMVIDGDAVTLATNGYTASFASSNVANGITVTVAGLSLGGAQAGNYTLTQPAGLTANITPLGLTVSGLTISNKVYDGTAAANLNTNNYTFNTVIGGDVVTLVTNGYIATFVSSNVANNISVTVTNLSLGGAQAGNYSLTQPTGLTANITPAGSSLLLVSSANPVAHLSAVSFTAGVTPSTLSGSVLFLTNGVAFNSQTLSGGTATSASTTLLPRGTNLITAQYSGTANYSPSTNTLNQVVTNNPPTADPAVYYRLVGFPLTIPVANLATNWNDLDGDPLALAGVSAPSTNGGTVTYDSTNIYYNDGNNVTDRFGYTISDGQGGTTNGIVTVLMAQQSISGVTVNGNGGMILDFTGIPGGTYWVETTTNLTSLAIWTPVSTNMAGTNGLWQFTDTYATNFSQRFYRTQLSH
ncbi:MAG: YDG domain-containing protein [Verrucomicrobiia bacterium]